MAFIAEFSVDLHCRPLKASFCLNRALSTIASVSKRTQVLFSVATLISTSPHRRPTKVAPSLSISLHRQRSTIVITDQETEPSPSLQTKIVNTLRAQ